MSFGCLKPDFMQNNIIFTTKRIHNKINYYHFLIFMNTENNNKLQFSHTQTL